MYNIWITGASRGIGQAIALEIATACQQNKENKNEALSFIGNDSLFYRQDIRLILTCHSSVEALSKTARIIQDMGISCMTVIGDVGSIEDCDRMLGRIHEYAGHVNLLINNAGIAYIGLLQDMSAADIQKVLNTNLQSAIYLSSCVVPDLLRSQGSKILNISSVWGNVGASCEAVYSASKGGLNSFTKALGKELAPSHIPVNAISCGVIDTAMNQCLTEEDKQELENEIPAGRSALASEVARLACLILSAPDYLTGQVITFDGGWQ